MTFEEYIDEMYPQIQDYQITMEDLQNWQKKTQTDITMNQEKNIQNYQIH